MFWLCKNRAFEYMQIRDMDIFRGVRDPLREAYLQKIYNFTLDL